MDNLRKEFQKKVKERIRPLLKDAGFDEFSDLTAWKHASRWIDCVQLLTLSASQFGLPRYLGPNTNATDATFQLCVGTYYLDVHLLPWMGDPPKRPRIPRGEAPRYPTVHRYLYLVRPYDRAHSQDTVWRVNDDGSNLESVVESARQALIDRGLPWLEMTHNIPGYLEGQVRKLPPNALEFTPEEQAQFEAWLRDQHLPPDERLIFPVLYPSAFVSAAERLKKKMWPEDHEASGPVPSHDERLGLLLGEGRQEEAFAQLREEADLNLMEDRLAEFAETFRNEPGNKRLVSSQRRFELQFVERAAEKLRMLETAYPAR